MEPEAKSSCSTLPNLEPKVSNVKSVPTATKVLDELSAASSASAATPTSRGHNSFDTFPIMLVVLEREQVTGRPASEYRMNSQSQ